MSEFDTACTPEIPVRKKRFSFITMFHEWIIPFGIEILAVIAIIKFLFFFAYVPTGSMIPTIAEQSWIFSTRVYDTDSIKRGDILVFESDELDIILIKRVIGLPGEQVDIKEGKVYINGVLLNEPYVVNASRETMSFTVPEGCYLFFGDNRTHSNDARLWRHPYIPAEKITGKALFTIFPFKNFGTLN